MKISIPLLILSSILLCILLLSSTASCGPYNVSGLQNFTEFTAKVDAFFTLIDEKGLARLQEIQKLNETGYFVTQLPSLSWPLEAMFNDPAKQQELIGFGVYAASALGVMIVIAVIALIIMVLLFIRRILCCVCDCVFVPEFKWACFPCYATAMVLIALASLAGPIFVVYIGFPTRYEIRNLINETTRLPNDTFAEVGAMINGITGWIDDFFEDVRADANGITATLSNFDVIPTNMDQIQGVIGFVSGNITQIQNDATAMSGSADTIRSLLTSMQSNAFPGFPTLPDANSVPDFGGSSFTTSLDSALDAVDTVNQTLQTTRGTVEDALAQMQSFGNNSILQQLDDIEGQIGDIVTPLNSAIDDIRNQFQTAAGTYVDQVNFYSNKYAYWPGAIIPFLLLVLMLISLLASISPFECDIVSSIILKIMIVLCFILSVVFLAASGLAYTFWKVSDIGCNDHPIIFEELQPGLQTFLPFNGSFSIAEIIECPANYSLIDAFGFRSMIPNISEFIGPALTLIDDAKDQINSLDFGSGLDTSSFTSSSSELTDQLTAFNIDDMRTTLAQVLADTNDVDGYLATVPEIQQVLADLNDLICDPPNGYCYYVVYSNVSSIDTSQPPFSSNPSFQQQVDDAINSFESSKTNLTNTVNDLRANVTTLDGELVSIQTSVNSITGTISDLSTTTNLIVPITTNIMNTVNNTLDQVTDTVNNVLGYQDRFDSIDTVLNCSLPSQLYTDAYNMGCVRLRGLLTLYTLFIAIAGVNFFLMFLFAYASDIKSNLGIFIAWRKRKTSLASGKRMMLDSQQFGASPNQGMVNMIPQHEMVVLSLDGQPMVLRK